MMTEKNKQPSNKAKASAKRFIKAIQEKKIIKETLPNNAERLQGINEQMDYEHFLEFRKTDFYKELLEQ
jgi:hypothetical protein